MTPEEEKAHILAAIEAGKAAYQRKKENMEYIISENLENDCVYAYAAKEFWVYDKQACRWYTSGFCREQYERAKQKLSRLTPEDFLADSDAYSLLDDYELPSAALNALQEAVKSGKQEVAPFEGAVSAPVDAQCKDEDADDRGIMTDAGELLPNGTECRRHAVSRARTEMGKVQAIHVCDDQPEGVKIWLNACEPAEYWVLSKAGEIGGEHIEGCPYCAALLRIGCGDVLLMPINREPKSNKPPEPADSEGSPRPNPGDVYRSAKGGRLYKIGEGYDGKKTYYRTMRYDTHNCIWEPANGSLYPELSNAQGEFEAWIRTEQLEPVAPNGDAAANTAANAAQQPQPEETPITPTNASSSSDPACPADAGAATQSLSAAGAASLAAEPAPKFDYSGMDIATVDTLHWAEREIGEARRDYVARLAQAVYIVHDELVQNLHKQNNQHSESTFVSWCASIGLSRRTAYNLLQVNALLSGSTPEEQATLEAASPSLLYAAAKPSAPAELVQAVKDGDITTHKQYQEAMAQLKAEREARKQAEQQLADVQRANQAEREFTSVLLRDEQQRRQKAEEGRIAAEQEKQAAQRRADVAEKERDGARQALRGTRKQEEKWREKAQAVQEQLDQLQAQPIPSTAIDIDEVERRVAERVEAECARLAPRDEERARQDSRDAYDAFILAARSLDNIWKTLKPQVARLDPREQNGAKNLLLQQLMKVKEELIHECENRQSGS